MFDAVEREGAPLLHSARRNDALGSEAGPAHAVEPQRPPRPLSSSAAPGEPVKVVLVRVVEVVRKFVLGGTPIVVPPSGVVIGIRRVREPRLSAIGVQRGFAVWILARAAAAASTAV